ncbi:MAG: S41 family peptidase [Planctomycetes bacterium]|nr:S41 family peptidase [Planctomycetota bacterium]
MRRPALLATAACSFAFLAGLGLHSALPGLFGQSNEEADTEQLQRIRQLHDLIAQAYVDEKPSREIYDGALKGMFEHLDPYSEYLTPEEFAELKVDTTGEFGGLGIEVILEDDVLTVVSPLEDTPAFRGGVQPGDKIIEVDGASTEGMSITDAVKRLRGKPGTPVEISVFHRGALAPVKIPLVREVIHVRSVKGARLVDPAAGVGYLRINGFQEDTVKEFDATVAELRKQGMKALIIDLRFNGGGLLQEAVDLADRFLDEGVIVATRGRARGEAHSYKARKGNTLPGLPLAVLVNGSSASASEIFAGAMQDTRRALVVGTRTFGKGCVQSILPLDDDQCAVKLTTAKYYTPSGRCIHREKDAKTWGIDPDLDVPFTPQQEVALWDSRRFEDVLTPPAAGDASAAPTPPAGASPGTPPKEPFSDTQLQRAVDGLKTLLIYGKERK